MEQVYEQTRYPAIFDLSKDTLSDTVKLLRDYRDKARDRARQQRLEARQPGAVTHQESREPESSR